MKPAEKYIVESAEPQRSIMLHLQLVVLRNIPTLQLLYKWRMPSFYVDGKSPFCFINNTKGYVDLLFYHGAHLTKNTDVLLSKDRKYMKSLRYFTLEQIDEKVLIEVLKEAYSVKDRKYYN